jgi:lysophospholipase L1-like esterase
MKTSSLTVRKKFVFAAVTAAVSMVLGFVVLEGYVRAFRPHVDLDQLTGRTSGPNPISEWGFVDAFCAYAARPGRFAEGKTVNSHGFISTPEITPAKSEGTIRIVFLGESSTAGMTVNLKDPDTWPWQTIEIVQEQAPRRVDFINAALGGYTSFESYGRLWSRIRHFSPDIVVVAHGWNEMYYFKKADDIVSWRTGPDGSWSLSGTGAPRVTFPPHWIDPCLKWSQVLTRIRRRLSAVSEGEIGAKSDHPLESDFNHRGIAIWRTNLRLLRETCSLLGARLFVAKQATLVVPSLPPEEQARCRYDLHGFDHDAHVAAFREIYQVIDEEIPADSIIDLTPLSGRIDLFFDHVHPTPQGSREIATIVAKALVADIARSKSGESADRADK